MENPKSNPIHEVEASFSRAHELCERVNRIVARLCGDAPTSESNGEQKAAWGGGILGDLRDQAGALNDHIIDCGLELDRLESALPPSAQPVPGLGQLLRDQQASTGEIRAR